MNSQGVDNDGDALLGCEIAQALNENKDNYGLLVRQTRIHRDIHEVRLHRY